MSNDVWGTPSVAGDLLYVTSFEVHALDVATGRRRSRPGTSPGRWRSRTAVSTPPTARPCSRSTPATAPSAGGCPRTPGCTPCKADRGTVVTATRGGGVQGWEASNGQKLWELTGAQTDFETPEAGPVVHDGTVYVWKDAPAARPGRPYGRRALVLPDRRRGLLRRTSRSG